MYKVESKAIFQEDLNQIGKQSGSILANSMAAKEKFSSAAIH